jgi:predicted transcriptional regulator
MVEPADGGRDEEGVRHFIERFGLDLVEAGMPRMPARVFAAVLVSERGRLTAAELADQLQVSPAAISGAVRYLVQLRMLGRGREPGERRDHYRVSSDMWYEVTLQRDQMLTGWEQHLQDGIKAAGPDTAAGARLEDSRRYFEFLRGQMLLIMDRWRQVRSEGTSGPGR